MRTIFQGYYHLIYYNYSFLVLEKKKEFVIFHAMVSLQCSVMMGDTRYVNDNYNIDYCGSKFQN